MRLFKVSKFRRIRLRQEEIFLEVSNKNSKKINRKPSSLRVVRN